MAIVAGAAGCRFADVATLRHVAHPPPQEQPLPAPPGADAGAGAAVAEAARSAPSEAAPPARAVARKAVPEIRPDSLFGLDRQAVEALLGPPSFVRREKPSELWRYRHGSCALALFLHADGSGRDASFRVRHIESWAPGGEQTPPGECLNALARRARQQPAG